jgi:cytochrome o ubiquinol oxidase operon protein cyoD
MNESHVTLKSYVLGFIISLLLTLSAYFVATSPTLTSTFALSVIITLAFIQFIAQVIFFLHLGKETKPRWNLFIFFTTLVGMIILVAGSLWIMHHLNYNMMPNEMNDHFMEEEGIYQ